MGMSAVQSSAFKAASGEMDISALHLLSLGLLLPCFFSGRPGRCWMSGRAGVMRRSAAQCWGAFYPAGSPAGSQYLDVCQLR